MQESRKSGQECLLDADPTRHSGSCPGLNALHAVALPMLVTNRATHPLTFDFGTALTQGGDGPSLTVRSAAGQTQSFSATRLPAPDRYSTQSWISTITLTPGLNTIEMPGTQSGDRIEELVTRQLLFVPVDRDGDGIPDAEEGDSNPVLADTDGDGLTDAIERVLGTSPVRADTDSDGLDDLAELRLGLAPTNRDHDGDGYSDGVERLAGTDPKSATSVPTQVIANTLLAELGGRLILVNTTTGEKGDLGAPSPLGLGFGIDGASSALYVSALTELVSVHPLSGAAAPLGALGGAESTIRSLQLALNPATSTLYGVESDANFAATGQLLEIDRRNGAALRRGLASSPLHALTFSDAGTAYAAVAVEGAADDLVTLDPATGATTRIGSLGRTPIYGLTFIGNVLYAAHTADPESTLLTVDPATAATTALWNVRGRLRDLSRPAAPAPGGEACEGAVPITAGTYENQSTIGFANDDTGGANCGVGSRPGPDKVYRIEVPSGKRLTLTATPAISTPQYDLAIHLKDGPNCGALRCVGGDVIDSGGGPSAASTAIYDNGASAPRTVYIYVDSFRSSTSEFISHQGIFTLTATLTDTPAGESCLRAPTLTPPQTLVGESTVGFVNNLFWSTQCSVLGAGRDRAYRVVIPPGERLVASITPTTAGYDPNLALVVGNADACEAAAITCAAFDNSGTATATNTVQYTNPTTDPQEAFILVDNGLVLDAGGAFTLSVALQTSGGETCATARALSSGTTLTAQTTVGMANDYANRFACPGFGDAPDAAYVLALQPGQRVQVTATPSAADDVNLSLFVGTDATSCDGLCARYARLGSTGQAESMGYTNYGQSAQNAYVVVDSFSGPGGTYSIRADVDTPPPHDACEVAQPLSGSATLSGTTSGYTDDYSQGCGRPGPDRAYSLTLQNNERLIARLTATTPGYNARLHLYPGGDPAQCGSVLDTCVAKVGGADPAATRTLEQSNRSGAAVSYYLVVESEVVGAGGDYNLEIELGPTPVSPAGDRCDTATPITLGTPLQEALSGDFADDHQDYCALAGQTGRDKVYSVSVPATERLRVTATPAAGFDVDLALMTAAGCATTTTAACLAKSQAAVSGQTETILWNNTTGATADLRILVDSRQPSAQGNYTLEARLDTLAADLCERAEPLTGSGLVTGTLVGYTNDYQGGTNCGATSGADRVYQVLVPASYWLTTVVRPTGWDSALSLVAGPASNCAGTRTCLTSGNTTGSGRLDVARHRNTGASAQDVFVVVENPSSTAASGPFDLLYNVEPASAGEDCAGAVALSGPGTVVGSTEGYVNNYQPTSSCTGFGATGRDRVYSIEVPAGQRLTATVQPANTTFDPAIYLLAAPVTNCVLVPTCLVGDDSGEQAQVNSVSYLNTTGAARTLYIVVDSASSSTTGPFLMTATLGP